MAKKKTEKNENLAEWAPVELQARLRESQDALFRARFRHATSPLKNPMELRQLRRTIARLKTYLRQKEVHA